MRSVISAKIRFHGHVVFCQYFEIFDWSRRLEDIPRMMGGEILGFKIITNVDDVHTTYCEDGQSGDFGGDFNNDFLN